MAKFIHIDKCESTDGRKMKDVWLNADCIQALRKVDIHTEGGSDYHAVMIDTTIQQESYPARNEKLYVPSLLQDAEARDRYFKEMKDWLFSNLGNC